MTEHSEIDGTAWNYLFFAWVLAAIATAGSLFFSEVMEFVPCSLCWYQRIFMYPLVVILFIAAFNINKLAFTYSFPFVVIGWLISIYHNLIQWEIIPESASPCVQGNPCTAVWIDWLGFITIPLLAFFAFSSIGIVLLIFRKKFLLD